jgi:hypothetical protein
MVEDLSSEFVSRLGRFEFLLRLEVVDVSKAAPSSSCNLYRCIIMSQYSASRFMVHCLGDDDLPSRNIDGCLTVKSKAER